MVVPNAAHTSLFLLLVEFGVSKFFVFFSSELNKALTVSLKKNPKQNDNNKTKLPPLTKIDL